VRDRLYALEPLQRYGKDGESVMKVNEVKLSGAQLFGLSELLKPCYGNTTDSFSEVDKSTLLHHVGMIYGTSDEPMQAETHHCINGRWLPIDQEVA
jgi:hypothetical protein